MLGRGPLESFMLHDSASLRVFEYEWPRMLKYVSPVLCCLFTIVFTAKKCTSFPLQTVSPMYSLVQKKRVVMVQCFWWRIKWSFYSKESRYHFKESSFHFKESSFHFKESSFHFKESSFQQRIKFSFLRVKFLFQRTKFSFQRIKTFAKGQVFTHVCKFAKKYVAIAMGHGKSEIILEENQIFGKDVWYAIIANRMKNFERYAKGKENKERTVCGNRRKLWKEGWTWLNGIWALSTNNWKNRPFYTTRL